MSTRALGSKRGVPVPQVQNHHLAHAIHLWALPPSQRRLERVYYHAHRGVGDTHHQALRALGDRWVGILQGCLAHHCAYDEHIAWGHRSAPAPDKESARAAIHLEPWDLSPQKWSR